MFNWNQIKLILFFMTPSIMIGIIAGSFPGYELYKYTWYNAHFCTQCHVHDYASVGWAQSAHGPKTTCHDCHHQRLRDYFKEMYIMIKDRPKFPEDLHHTPYVKKELCSACHVSNAADRSTITGPFQFEDVMKIPKVDKSHLHFVHLNKKTDLILQNHKAHTANERNLENLHPTIEPDLTKGAERQITCADCHGGPQNRGHNFSAVDATCVRCHQESHKSKISQQYGCRSCHFQDFLIPISEKKPAQENF